jgi:RNA polymerase sigma-70 factor, ECF subfamily
MLAIAATSAPVPPADLTLARAKRGDVRAFEALYREHVGRVYGLCLRMTRDAHLAEDCTQETFVNAWRALAGFEQRSSVSTWLHRIAVNTVLARTRRADNDDLASQNANSEEPDHNARAEHILEVEDLESLLGKLPAGARNVLVLFGIYGYSHEETAQMLNIAVGTCKAQLHRARQLLRELMAENPKR